MFLLEVIRVSFIKNNNVFLCFMKNEKMKSFLCILELVKFLVVFYFQAGIIMINRELYVCDQVFLYILYII